jgi:hypothetical protein
VFDGVQVFFKIQVGDGAEREITVRNKKQPDLQRLLDAINDVLPPKFQLSKLQDF